MTVTDVPALSQAEHARQVAHRAVDEIHRAWPHALVDSRSRGFPAGGGDTRSSVGDHSDPTANAALAGSKPEGWLAQLHTVAEALGCARRIDQPAAWHDAVERLCAIWPDGQDIHAALLQLANLAARWWPKEPKVGDEVAGVTVGVRRSNQVGVCHACGEPVVPGNGPQGRRWVQDPATGDRLEFHKSPCFYQYHIDRQRGAAS